MTLTRKGRRCGELPGKHDVHAEPRHRRPLLAARYMEATASRSTRCMKPVYHPMVAQHERERPSAEIMHEVARRTLEMAGLGGHQALVMGHGDTPHRHFHVMLDRVHPETRRADGTWS